MMSTQNVPSVAEAVLVRRAGAVGHVLLSRPAALNAITVEMADRLADALVDLADRVDVVILRGAGGNFSVGGDYHELERLRLQGPDAMRTLFDAFGRACRTIAAVPVPVLAAVEGYAMAGGFELMQSCDVVVVRDDAVIADNHANFAMVPGGGGSQRLPRLVGRPRALAHMLTGERITGAQAAAWGLAHRAVVAADFERTVHEVAERLAAKDRLTLARIKRLVRDGEELPLDAALALETDAVVEHLRRDGAMDRFTQRGAADR